MLHLCEINTSDPKEQKVSVYRENTFHFKVKQNRYHSHIMHINIVLIYLVVDRGLHTFIMHMNVMVKLDF